MTQDQVNGNEFEKYYQAALNDIYVIDESYRAVFFISDHLSEIRANNLAHIFGRLQFYFFDAMTLAVGRLFDQRRDVLSIPSMASNIGAFALENECGFLDALPKLGAQSDFIAAIGREKFSVSAVENLKKLVPNKDSLPELQRVLNRRHKEVAHRGDLFQAFDRPTFSDVKRCNEIAKDWITCFALGFKNMHLRDDAGNFFLTDDAEGTARELHFVLKLLHVVPPVHPSETSIIDSFHSMAIRRLVATKKS